MGKWVHRLSNVDTVSRTADCANCGAGVPIYVNGKRSMCATAREDRRVNYAPTHSTNKRAKLYGLTPLELTELLQRQDYKCAICGAEKSLYVDHCHTTGLVRGMLCHHCNAMLGFARDREEVLLAAISYLQG